MDGTWGQVSYKDGYPFVTVIEENVYEPSISIDAQNVSPVIYSGSVLDGSYLVAVDLFAGKLRVSSRAPSYAYIEATINNNWYVANCGGNVTAKVTVGYDTITLYGPFGPSTGISMVIRSHLHGTMQSGPANQGWQGVRIPTTALRGHFPPVNFHHGFRSAPHLQLLVGVVDVSAHRLDADAKLAGDFFVMITLGQQSDDLFLSRG